MSGLSMGAMCTKSVTRHPETFSYIGLFSGGSIARTKSWTSQVKHVFMSYGSRERGSEGWQQQNALNKAGVKAPHMSRLLQHMNGSHGEEAFMNLHRCFLKTEDPDYPEIS